MSPSSERVTATSSWPPWSLWGTAGAAVCYPTLQKMLLLQLGGKETKQLPFNYSVAGASWGPGWSQRKILADASCNRTTWAGAKKEPGGDRGSLACASAGTSVLCLGTVLHGPFSCPLLFSPELSVQPPRPGSGLGLTPSLQP